MLVYPQLGTGALGQFPLRKQHRVRTVVNTAADGSSVRLADPNSETTEWQLPYSDLSDGEVAALESFFAAAEGTLNSFVFPDPSGNLLSWSGKLDENVWVREPLITVTGGVSDPFGGTQAWRLTNAGTAAQAVTQTMATPGGYLYCLSAYVRASQAMTATMLIGSARTDRAVTSQWTRIAFALSGDGAATSTRTGLEVPPASSLEVFGLQAEPQNAPSVYKVTTAGGVYENARLADDRLIITTTAVNRHSCTVNIIHAKHL